MLGTVLPCSSTIWGFIMLNCVFGFLKSKSNSSFNIRSKALGSAVATCPMMLDAVASGFLILYLVAALFATPLSVLGLLLVCIFTPLNSEYKFVNTVRVSRSLLWYSSSDLLRSMIFLSLSLAPLYTCSTVRFSLPVFLIIAPSSSTLVL